MRDGRSGGFSDDDLEIDVEGGLNGVETAAPAAPGRGGGRVRVEFRLGEGCCELSESMLEGSS
jgi:hypothetical protein